MTDTEIIEKYFERSEEAISMTRQKYGKLCRSVANNILKNVEDSEECVSDTYFRAWNTIPPTRPSILSAFLCKITRNLALDRYRKNNTVKRGKDNVTTILSELEECLLTYEDTNLEETITDKIALEDVLNQFLGSLKPDDRKIFVNRYFLMKPVKDIADKYRLGQSKVKMSLLRSRESLRVLLEKEGFLL